MSLITFQTRQRRGDGGSVYQLMETERLSACSSIDGAMAVMASTSNRKDPELHDTRTPELACLAALQHGAISLSGSP